MFLPSSCCFLNALTTLTLTLFSIPTIHTQHMQPAAPSFAESEPNVARVNLAPNVEDEDADLSLVRGGLGFMIEHNVNRSTIERLRFRWRKRHVINWESESSPMKNVHTHSSPSFLFFSFLWCGFVKLLPLCHHRLDPSSDGPSRYSVRNRDPPRLPRPVPHRLQATRDLSQDDQLGVQGSVEPVRADSGRLRGEHGLKGRALQG